MWNPLSLLMWLSLWLLMFTFLGLSATQPWTHLAMLARPSRSHPYPSNFRNMSCWLYSNISGSRVNYRHMDALSIHFEEEMSPVGALQMCTSEHVAGSLPPSLQGRGLVREQETYKVYTLSSSPLTFSNSKMVIRMLPFPTTPPYFYILGGGVKLWMFEVWRHLSVWVFLITWAYQILKFIDLGTHS